MSIAGAAVRERDAPLVRVLDDLQRVRVLEQRLRRDAAPDQTGAAERLLLLDDGDLLPELRGADRGDIAARTRADHDDIVWHSGTRRLLSQVTTGLTRGVSASGR